MRTGRADIYRYPVKDLSVSLSQIVSVLINGESAAHLFREAWDVCRCE
jgi:hypothetical protein